MTPLENGPERDGSEHGARQPIPAGDLYVMDAPSRQRSLAPTSADSSGPTGSRIPGTPGHHDEDALRPLRTRIMQRGVSWRLSGRDRRTFKKPSRLGDK